MERKVLESSARELILKVKEFCELEKKNKELLIPLNNVQMRVAAMTGVSVKTVSRITKEGKIAASTSKKIVTPGKSRPRPKKYDLDESDLRVIRQKINFCHMVKKELPTVNKLRLELKEDINFQGSNTTLRRILKNLGVQFKRCQSKRKVLMECYDRRTEAAFANITADDRRIQCEHVKNVEDQYSKNDGLIDVEMERFIISTQSDTESDPDSEFMNTRNSDCDMSGIKPLSLEDHNYCTMSYR